VPHFVNLLTHVTSSNAERLPTIYGLCGTEYGGGECPACKAERESAKRAIEEKLRRDREEKDRVIRDVEVWLEERGE
jgi:hypothetical protein